MHRRLWISTNTVAEQQAFARFASEIRHFIDAVLPGHPGISSTSKYLLFILYTECLKIAGTHYYAICTDFDFVSVKHT